MTVHENNNHELIAGTNDLNLSEISGNMDAYNDISRGRGDLGSLDDNSDKKRRDQLGYARILTPEDYVDRTPSLVKPKLTLAQRALGFFGIKKQ